MFLTGCTIASQEDLSIIQKEVDGIVGYDDATIKAQLIAIEATLTTLESEVFDDKDLQAKVTTLLSNVTSLLESIETINTTLGTSKEADMLAQLAIIESTLLVFTTDLLDLQTDILSLAEDVASISNSGGQTNYDYIYDVDGKYISGRELIGLLTTKYFGVASMLDLVSCNPICYYVSRDIFIGIETNEIVDMNDLFARYTLMIEEFRLYKFYYENRSGIDLDFYSDVDETYQYFYFGISTLHF